MQGFSLGSGPVIVGAVRTPIGKANPVAPWPRCYPKDLLAHTLRQRDRPRRRSTRPWWTT